MFIKWNKCSVNTWNNLCEVVPNQILLKTWNYWSDIKRFCLTNDTWCILQSILSLVMKIRVKLVLRNITNTSWLGKIWGTFMQYVKIISSICLLCECWPSTPLQYLSISSPPRKYWHKKLSAFHLMWMTCSKNWSKNRFLPIKMAGQFYFIYWLWKPRASSN